MKKREGYDFKRNDDYTFFCFTSIGFKGKIKKVVEFSEFDDAWNLAFGDGTRNNFDDEVVSGNDDMRKIMQTIANIVHSFASKYPDRKIYIEPVDERRKILYNRIFQQKEEEIRYFFFIEGHLLNEGIREHYQKWKIYDAFVISPKETIFED